MNVAGTINTHGYDVALKLHSQSRELTTPAGKISLLVRHEAPDARTTGRACAPRCVLLSSSDARQLGLPKVFQAADRATWSGRLGARVDSKISTAQGRPVLISLGGGPRVPLCVCVCVCVARGPCVRPYASLGGFV